MRAGLKIRPTGITAGLHVVGQAARVLGGPKKLDRDAPRTVSVLDPGEPTSERDVVAGLDDAVASGVIDVLRTTAGTRPFEVSRAVREYLRGVGAEPMQIGIVTTRASRLAMTRARERLRKAEELDTDPVAPEGSAPLDAAEGKKPIDIGEAGPAYNPEDREREAEVEGLQEQVEEVHSKLSAVAHVVPPELREAFNLTKRQLRDVFADPDEGKIKWIGHRVAALVAYIRETTENPHHEDSTGGWTKHDAEGKASKAGLGGLKKSLHAEGPYVGPKGGLYADPDHKTPWKGQSAVAPSTHADAKSAISHAKKTAKKHGAEVHVYRDKRSGAHVTADNAHHEHFRGSKHFEHVGTAKMKTDGKKAGKADGKGAPPGGGSDGGAPETGKKPPSKAPGAAAAVFRTAAEIAMSDQPVTAAGNKIGAEIDAAGLAKKRRDLAKRHGANRAAGLDVHPLTKSMGVFSTPAEQAEAEKLLRFLMVRRYRTEARADEIAERAATVARQSAEADALLGAV